MLQGQFQHLCAGQIVTVTIVRITPDLSFARVYVSAFPTKAPKVIVEDLNAHIQEICHALYQRVRNQFRKMPEIRFYLDDSLDYAERIDDLLKS